MLVARLSESGVAAKAIVRSASEAQPLKGGKSRALDLKPDDLALGKTKLVERLVEVC